LGGFRQLLKAGVDRLGACDVEAAAELARVGPSAAPFPIRLLIL